MEEKKICAIFAGGPENGEPCLPVPENAYIMCADSGLRLAERLLLHPDLVLGDFDSLGAVPVDLPHMAVPVEKDETDTLLAVKTALDRGFRDIRIYGAFGGRLDHTFANFETLEYLRKAGAEGFLCGVRDCAYMLLSGERIRLPKREGWSLSLFAWSEQCGGVTERGVYYPLEDAALTRSFPLGISNRIIADEAEICCESGTLLVMQSKL